MQILEWLDEIRAEASVFSIFDTGSRLLRTYYGLIFSPRTTFREIDKTTRLGRYVLPGFFYLLNLILSYLTIKFLQQDGMAVPSIHFFELIKFLAYCFVGMFIILILVSRENGPLRYGVDIKTSFSRLGFLSVVFVPIAAIRTIGKGLFDTRAEFVMASFGWQHFPGTFEILTPILIAFLVAYLALGVWFWHIFTLAIASLTECRPSAARRGTARILFRYLVVKSTCYLLLFVGINVSSIYAYTQFYDVAVKIRSRNFPAALPILHSLSSSTYLSPYHHYITSILAALCELLVYCHDTNDLAFSRTILDFIEKRDFNRACSQLDIHLKQVENDTADPKYFAYRRAREYLLIAEKQHASGGFGEFNPQRISFGKPVVPFGVIPGRSWTSRTGLHFLCDTPNFLNPEIRPIYFPCNLGFGPDYFDAPKNRNPNL